MFEWCGTDVIHRIVFAAGVGVGPHFHDDRVTTSVDRASRYAAERANFRRPLGPFF
jgi:hypothetical protein